MPIARKADVMAVDDMWRISILATDKSAQLLFKGDDFGRTDVMVVEY
jgi:uncharacterized protein with PIN domain